MNADSQNKTQYRAKQLDKMIDKLQFKSNLRMIAGDKL